jgi:multidrug resistance protein, MATE family
MSSTYVHYAGGPGSLPNDYAILSRYAHDNASAQSVVADSTNDFDDDETILPDGTSHETSGVKRRPSYPATHIRPPMPSIASLPNSRVDELTPLLNGPSMPIPRIQEAPDANDQDGINTMTMFWEEFFILIRYTLPVFGTHLLELVAIYYYYCLAY